MKTLKITLLLLVALFAFVANSMAYVSFPYADFQGMLFVDLDQQGGVQRYAGSLAVTQYIDGNFQVYSAANSSDPILRQFVDGSIFSSLDFDLADSGTIVPAAADSSFQLGGADPYLTATAQNITASHLMSTADHSQQQYLFSADLYDQSILHLNESYFLREYLAVSSADGPQGRILAWLYTFRLAEDADWDYLINVSGQLSPVPAPIPAAFWLLGSGLFGLGLLRRKG